MENYEVFLQGGSASLDFASQFGIVESEVADISLSQAAGVDPLTGLAGDTSLSVGLGIDSLMPAETGLDSEAAGSALNALDQAFTSVRGSIRDALTNTNFDFSLDLPGLTDEVEVQREPSGMVHIQAQNDNDLFYTLGFVHAHDRLWQMDFQRRLGAGQLSEVLGEASLEQDIFMRTLGIYQAAESAYQNLSPEVKQVVDNYTNGINAYLSTDIPLPLEFQILDYKPEPWQPADILAWLKVQSFNLSANWDTELFRAQLLTQGLSPERIQEIFPPYPEDAPTILQASDLNRSALSLREQESVESLPASNLDLPVESMKSILGLNQFISPLSEASNNWVVSGSRTTTGKPFLANDPHLGLQIPSLWYLAHLESPTLEVIGATFPGIPGVAIGHNNQIAWGITNVGADVQDIYVLAETPDNRGYLYQGQVLPYQVRLETIPVRGAEDVVIPVRQSVYGPVISDALGLDQPLALRWVGLDPVDGTQGAFLDINRAQNWEDFTQALQSFAAPSLNFVYADTEGNIGYFAPGRIPIRQPEHTGLVPVPGTGEFDWQGFIPFEQLPQVLNPAEGFIVTANNRVAPSEYPYPISLEWAEPYRAERIRELILSKNQLSLEDMQAIQLDQVSLLYRDFRPILERLAPLSERAGIWRDRLLDWDGNTQPDSVEATVFEGWYNELARFPAAAIGQEFLEGNALGAVPRYLLQAIQNGDPALDQPGSEPGGVDDAARVLEEVLERFGDSVPPWGEIHQAVLEHPVLPISRQVPFGGDRYTVNVGPYNPQTFDMRNGPSYRQVVDLENLENSLFIHPIGQSGQLLSPYFDNLLPLWQQGEYLPMKTEGYPVALNLVLEPSAGNNQGIGTQINDTSISSDNQILTLLTGLQATNLIDTVPNAFSLI